MSYHLNIHVILLKHRHNRMLVPNTVFKEQSGDSATERHYSRIYLVVCLYLGSGVFMQENFFDCITVLFVS